MNRVKIKFTGDLMCTMLMEAQCGGAYERFFAAAEKELHDCDYLVGNLETPIAGGACGYTKERYCFNTPERYLAVLKDAGFHLLSLANNHCMDRGETGMLTTAANCRKYGFDITGINMTDDAKQRVFFKDLCGIKTAFINYTYGTNAFAHHRFLSADKKYTVNLLQPEETLDGSIHLLNTASEIAKETERLYGGTVPDNNVLPFIQRLQEDIRFAKQHADFVIFLLRCGGQYNDVVDAYTKYIAETVKAAGADFIVGNHPHIIQESDFSHGTVYSLGNFICAPCEGNSDSPAKPFNAVLSITLEKENGKTHIAEKSFHLMYVDETGGCPVAVNTAAADIPEKDILYYANRFAPHMKYRKKQWEYGID